MDWDILRALNHFASRHDLFEDPLTSYIRSSQFLFAALIALIFLIAGRNRFLGARAALSALASSGLALAAGQLIGGLVDRPRPYAAHPGALHLYVARTSDPSFPSDHATAAFAIATSILLLTRRWGVPAIVMAALLAAGRVFVGAHYPTDVLGGALLGAGAAVLLRCSPAAPALDRLGDALARGRDAAYRRLSLLHDG